jgi:Lon protease-like protein
MFKASDLPEILPIFPLAGALLLPRGHLPLHLFEPRYLQMFEDALKTPMRMIGMVQPRDIPGGSDRPVLHQIGCAGRITAFSEAGDGRYMITLTGISRFRILDELDGFAPYGRAHPNWLDFARDLGQPEKDPEFDRDHFLDVLGRYFASEELDTDWESLRGAGDEMLINSLAMLCPFEAEDKQALLEAPTLATRRETARMRR